MKRLTPIKAIRAKCLDCSGDNRAEVKKCELDDCPLYHYRMGRRGDKPRKNVNISGLLRQRKASGATSANVSDRGRHE